MKRPKDLPMTIRARSLPATADEWNEYLEIKVKPTLNNEVHRLLLDKVNDPEWRKWLEAIWDDEAIEGSLVLDYAELAQLVRDEGKKQNSALVKGAKKKDLIHALKIVENRFPELSRKGRREEVLAQVGHEPVEE